MQDKPSSPGEEPNKLPLTDEEAMVGRAVLALIASLHPQRITLVELEQQLSKSPKDPVIEHVVQDLLDADLLQLDGPYLGATPIALYLSRLGMTDPKRPPESPESEGEED